MTFNCDSLDHKRQPLLSNVLRCVPCSPSCCMSIQFTSTMYCPIGGVYSPVIAIIRWNPCSATTPCLRGKIRHTTPSVIPKTCRKQEMWWSEVLLVLELRFNDVVTHDADVDDHLGGICHEVIQLFQQRNTLDLLLVFCCTNFPAEGVQLQLVICLNPLFLQHFIFPSLSKHRLTLLLMLSLDTILRAQQWWGWQQWWGAQ